MIVNFRDIVSFTKAQCNKCFVLKYQMPRTIDKSIVSFFESFGELKYDIDKVNLLKIVAEDDYIIEARLNQTIIKFGLPKELEHTNINSNYRKTEFEACLGRWLAEKYGVPIIMAKQGER